MNPEKLEKGKIYYHCSYSHPKLSIPEIETWIYLGKNILPDRDNESIDEYVFQYPHKYFGTDIKNDTINITTDDDKNDLDSDLPEYITMGNDHLCATIKNIEELISWLTSIKGKASNNSIE
jgi:hypothetical protein